MSYTDKFGNEAIEGSILFYSESEPYAESIHLVVRDDKGFLCGKTIVGNRNDKYFLAEEERSIDLKCYTENFLSGLKEGELRDAVVIGHKDTDPEMLTIEYAEKHYPLESFKK